MGVSDSAVSTKQEPTLFAMLTRALGFIPLALGLATSALGFLYEYLGYRFGGAVFSWSIMWGLAGIGVGFALLGTIKRRVAIVGVLACSASFALIADWHFRIASADEWFWRIAVTDTLGVTYGLSAITIRTVRKWRTKAASDAGTQ